MSRWLKRLYGKLRRNFAPTRRYTAHHFHYDAGVWSATSVQDAIQHIDGTMKTALEDAFKKDLVEETEKQDDSPDDKDEE